MNQKRCTKCEVVKALDCFNNLSSSKDGKKSQCKECGANIRKAYLSNPENNARHKASTARWVKNNPERIREINSKWERNNPEAHKASQDKWTASNRDKTRKSNSEWKKRNAEKISEYNAEYRVNNIEKIKEQHAKWGKDNPGKVNALTGKRRAAKLQATPPWLTKAQLKEIEDIYIEAKRLQEEDGIERHVDHIMPLQGETLCGMHVPWNLQILTATENLKKSNKV